MNHKYTGQRALQPETGREGEEEHVSEYEDNVETNPDYS